LIVQIFNSVFTIIDNTTHARKWVRLIMYVRNLGYPLTLKIGGPKTTYFRRLCNL